MFFLEAIVRLNASLLLRGMNAPTPIDPPLETLKYDVYTSDADLFYWQSKIMRPISNQEDQLEAHVTFQTDEIGFPNPAPIPEDVDIIILGRSFSMGAQATDPWPRQMNEKGGFTVLNLSQTGSGIATKIDYLQKFGLIRHPRWVLIEILPSMDIIDYQQRSKTIIQNIPFTIIHQLIHTNDQNKPSIGVNSYIYPISLDIPSRTEELTFFSYYLSALTVNQSDLESSIQWQTFSQNLLKLIEITRSNGACVVLLHAPTKPDIYIPLLQDLEQLEPIRSEITLWRLNASLTLEQHAPWTSDFSVLQDNAHAARNLLAKFAAQNNLIFVDPSISMTQAVLKEKSPFMRYDTHWSATGHQLVSDIILDTIKSASCSP